MRFRSSVVAALVGLALALSGCAADESMDNLEQQLGAAGFQSAQAIGFRIDASPSPVAASPAASSQKSRVLVATAMACRCGSQSPWPH